MNTLLSRYQSNRMVQRQQQLHKKAELEKHRKRVHDDLIRLGMSWYGLAKSESRFLHHVIHPQEAVKAIAYGQHKDGFALLVATNKRILFLDKKPMMMKEDEIPFDMVSGISFSNVGLISNVILHTRDGDYPIKVYNHKCAKAFVEFIESKCIQRRSDWQRSPSRQTHY